ncbi:MAG: hypothetical protein KAJ19_10360, partial [Gammaproteobacteria bacterium]|nr:hypothetical protein [Gammaproteobacteria bacterium]
MPTDEQLAELELKKEQEPSRPGGVTPPTKEPVKEKEKAGQKIGTGTFGLGVTHTGAMRESLLEQRAQGVIFRDVENDGVTDLTRSGVGPRPLNPWQTGEAGTYNGMGEPAERFPKELPKEAIGWDENGNPFYGGSTPFQEWQLRAHANLERSEQITEEQASWQDYNAPNVGQAFAGTPGQTGLQRLGGGLGAIFSGALETYKQTSESVDYMLAGGDTEVNRLQQGWRQMSHYGGETLQRLGSIAYQTKLFFGGIAHLAEEKFQFGAGVGDEPVHFTERDKQLRLASDQFTVAPAHDDLFWRNIGVSPETIDEYRQGALAGRMFYTSIWDNTVDRIRGISGTGDAGNVKKEEFLREMHANPNANPNLVVKKYENPAAEMWGEIIFDPLNVAEFGFKITKFNVMTSKAIKLFAEPASNVGKYLRGSRLTRVSGLVDEAQDIAKIDGLVNARMLDVAEVAKADTAWAKSKTVWGLTNSAKAHVSAGDLTQVSQWAWRMAIGADKRVNPDTFILIQRAIIKTAGDAEYLRLLDEGAEISAELMAKNKATIIEGLNELQRFPGYDIAFTEPGTRAALMMADTWKPSTVKKLKKALTSDPDQAKGLRAMLQASDDIIEKQTKKFFPDIIDKANEATGGYKVLAKTHKYMQDGPYKYFNKFFSTIYLGLNPGYAARNFMQNTLQGLLDEGIRGVVGFNSLDNLAAWGADVTPYAALREFKDLTAAAGEVNVKGSRKVFGILPTVGTDAAGKMEQVAGLKVFDRIYPKTMKKLLKRGLSF